MAKALIAIGVGKTTSDSFPALQGAAKDAKAFHAWGQTQGFDCKLFVDERGKKVRYADIFDAIDECVTKGTYSQIVVYFSGHGILTAPGCELWLLSGAPRLPSEAINVRGSIDNARGSGIEHVVFISDACRSLPRDMEQASLGTGSSLFSFLGTRPPLPEVDVFYATLPGNVALEVPPDATNQSYRGLMTQCLLHALEGRVQEVIHDVNEAGKPTRVVPCRPLKTWLTSALPLAAAAISLRLQQMPDMRIESDPTKKYLAKVTNTVPATVLPPSSTTNPHRVQTLQTGIPPGVARPRRLVASDAARGGADRRGRTRDSARSSWQTLPAPNQRAASIANVIRSTIAAPRRTRAS